MKAQLSIAACTLALIACNLSFQNVVLGQGGTVAAISDLALQGGGVVNGRLVSVQGTALANTEVTFFQLGKQVASSRTLADGTFQVAGLRPGVYDVVTAGGRGQYRVWAVGTAPPGSLTAAKIVGENTLPTVARRGVRQGVLGGRAVRWGAAAAAIGGTIAIVEHNKNSTPSD